MMRAWMLAWVIVVLSSSDAQARVERFAVLIGNNLGANGDAPLRHAESDALRMYDVLNRLGDFNAPNVLVLRGQTAENVRGALIALNERIRDSMSQADTRAVLVVYYSGHADSQNLHLGESKLPLSELRQLARGSAANFRLVVLDACRSGSLTRVKGGRRTGAFDLTSAASPNDLPNDGVAFLTASSASEDAQESDELGSAFFTNAFVSGLFGAADGDGDGEVVLDEAYRYAYEATLRATSRTYIGAQHPTFHYDLRGRGRLVLTRPRAHRGVRAELSFPAAHGFLLFRDSSDGPVVVELEREAQSRTLTVEPGRYFVRGRGAEALYEGLIDAQAGASQQVDLAELEKIDYARYVRKRGGSSSLAHGAEVGMSMRSALPNSSSVCLGGYAGYAIDWRGLGARIRYSSCASHLQNQLITASVLANDVSLHLHRAWDVSRFTFELGLGAGLTLFNQTFETRGRAAPQQAIVPFASLGTSVEASAGHGWYARLGIAVENHWLRMLDGDNQSAEARAVFALRSTLGAGKHF